MREDSDDVLFIDSSKHFEKKKNQNFLRNEDIEKLVTTYKQRIQEDKYSYKASLEEIKENDYNLNIPRYVDTFEEEEEIDLDEVSSELKELDKQIVENGLVIKSFCDELGIKTPF